MLKNITIYHICWTITAIFIGVFSAPIFYKDLDKKPVQGVQADVEEDHSQHFAHDHSQMDHGEIEVLPDSVPEVNIVVEKDLMSGWNLTVDTNNFKFSPQTVNTSNQMNEGHAHIYVNGEKLSRLYSTHFHLSEFPPGEHEISVSLNANDHSTFTHNGEPIIGKVSIIQKGRPMSMMTDPQ